MTSIGQKGLKISRFYTNGKSNPLDDVRYEKRSTKIQKGDGTVVYELKDYDCPDFWSQSAGDIASSKYFVKGGIDGDKNKRETSVRAMIHRVANTITTFGWNLGYFDSPGDCEAFYDELAYILVHQKAAFNSPVWFNFGLEHEYNIMRKGNGWVWNPDNMMSEKTTTRYGRPAGSACFIQKLNDSLNSIFDTIKNESIIFSNGAGSGCNYSALRGDREKLSLGGTSSGLLSFLKVFDAAAGATKSGGVNRRAARMMCVDIDHPEIESIIGWKAREEKKAKILIAAGYPNDFNGEAYATVSAQNANNSIRVTNAFMKAVESDGDWWTTMRTTVERDRKYSAKKLWKDIAQATWECGDPGIQFHDTINEWNTVPNTGKVNASNPCCFVGETLVDTSEGFIRIDELSRMSIAGENLPHVFCFDTEANMPIMREIKKAWKSGETSSIVEVKTEKGISVRCTEDHLFLMKDGTYKPARSLKAGDRLRKIGRSENENRSSRRIIIHRETPEFKNGCQWMSRFMWTQVNGEIPEGYEVHHKNEDCTDDRISNFDLIESSDHRVKHSQGSANPNFTKLEIEKLVETWDCIESKYAEQRRVQEEMLSEAISMRSAGFSFAKIAKELTAKGFKGEAGRELCGGSVFDILKRGGFRNSKNELVSVAKWNSYIRENGLSGIVPTANTANGIQGMAWSQFKDLISENRHSVNDSVSSVNRITLESKVDVFDIEVDGVHNFGVRGPESSGIHSIVVHNSEYMHVDDTACNLSSHNLRSFYKDEVFNVLEFKHVNEIMTLAKEIIVGASSYPTPAIAENSYKLRPLGIGYANLGALLMEMGFPYDSDAGRLRAALITSAMSGFSYAMSAKIAAVKGSFEHFSANREPMLGVIRRHARANMELENSYGCKPETFDHLYGAAKEAWNEALILGEKYGYRNSQISVLAPTGTISFLMDADTSGIEPDYSLVKDKLLAGGGWMKIVNQTVPFALKSMGYTNTKIGAIVDHIAQTGGVSGCELIESAHISVFDCAQASGSDGRFIEPMAHLKMMAAVQPFLSGAISKTCNVPKATTAQEIADIYMAAWRMGLKAVAIYRDGSKGSQPLMVGGEKASVTEAASDSYEAKEPAKDPKKEAPKPSLWENLAIRDEAVAAFTPERPAKLKRAKLPSLRSGVTQKASIGQQKVYFTLNKYPTGELGEVFITLGDDAGTTGALAGVLAKSISIGLQHGVPVEEYINAMAGTKFEPDGIVTDVDGVKFSTSITDLLAKVIAANIGKLEDYSVPSSPPQKINIVAPKQNVNIVADQPKPNLSARGPDCNACGGKTYRKGACFTCEKCFTQGGCG